MTRKDDPVQNVSFVQLVESHPCLWNSDLTTYSKKDEIHKAWLEVSSKTNDSVRNCRERWRTIRSSFQRSMKMARTTTGRHKRKYYLSKYLQFLVPFTKTRSKSIGLMTSGTPTTRTHPTDGPATTSQISVRKASTLTSQPPPLSLMTRSTTALLQVPALSINRQPSQSQASAASSATIATQPPMTSVNMSSGLYNHIDSDDSSGAEVLNIDADMGIEDNLTGGGAAIKTENSNECQAEHNNVGSCFLNSTTVTHGQQTMPLSEYTEWMKQSNRQGDYNDNNKNSKTNQRNDLNTDKLSAPADGDQFFLNSLLQYMKEMSGKQNRRFRQKAMALVNDVLDNND